MGNSPILSSSEIFTPTTDIEPIVSHLRLRHAEVNVVTSVTMCHDVMRCHEHSHGYGQDLHIATLTKTVKIKTNVLYRS